MSVISNYRYNALVRDVAIWSKAFDDAVNCKDFNAYVVDCVDRWIADAASKEGFCAKTLLYDVATYRVNPRATFESPVAPSCEDNLWREFVDFVKDDAPSDFAVLLAAVDKNANVKLSALTYIIYTFLYLENPVCVVQRCRAGDRFCAELTKARSASFYDSLIFICDKFARKTVDARKGENNEN